MNEFNVIFNSREIALGIWIIIAVIIGVCSKPGREFIKSSLPTIFCRKFIVFYIIFISFFTLTILYLRLIGFWEISLLKNTIFWVFFIELPLFVKTINQAKDERFFLKLIKENLALIVVLEFLLNFWTFSIAIELIIVPVSLFFGAVYAIAMRKKESQPIKKFLDGVLSIFSIIVIIFTLINLIKNPGEFWNAQTLKEFILPILLLFMNLPVVYGLALFNVYEQVYIRLNGNLKEKAKMRYRIFRFAGINLAKISILRRNINRTTRSSRTDKELKYKLIQFQEHLSTRIGDNYMKRSRFLIICYTTMAVICLVGIIALNSTAPLKDLLTFNIVFDIETITRAGTSALSIGLAFSICFLIYSVALKKKNYENISQIKKFALHDLIFYARQQSLMLEEFPPIDNPQNLFTRYISIAFEVKRECDRAIAMYENLLTNWEFDILTSLQSCTSSFIFSVGISDISEYTVDKFVDHYEKKKATSIQSEKINVFLSNLERNIGKYSEQIRHFIDTFKNCI